MKRLRLLLLALMAMLLPAAARAEPPDVVATIKPLHALVAAVMGEIGAPKLIVEGTASLHAYSLKPSNAEALQQAELVFWVGPGLELFLAEALHSLAVDAQLVELAETPGLELLPLRQGGVFASHEHSHVGDERADAGHHELVDLHFWLDPQRARLAVAAIAEALAAADPEHAAVYAGNARRYNDELAALTVELEAELAPVRAHPFIVFHDAYHYFEQRFGLRVAGSITVSPDTLPGARRIAELRSSIAASGVRCVFAEPQFQPAIVAAIIEGTGARSGELDPEGASLSPGPELYTALLRGLARDLRSCLGG